MVNDSFVVKKVKSKKPMEEMTDKELMAYCMKIKRHVSKEKSKMTPEELNAYYAALQYRIKNVYGIKYYTPPSTLNTSAASRRKNVK
jgi:hypothetical protein